MYRTNSPLTYPGEGVSVFTYPYLSAEAPTQGEVKGLIEQAIPLYETLYIIFCYYM